LVFNAGASFIFPGFRNLGNTGLFGKDTYNYGPIVYASDYLTVDGFFVGRGWGNSIGITNYDGRLINKKGYARFDFSLEYRVPIHEKFVWLATFIDMVNLIEGPTRTIGGTTESNKAWEWWNQTPNYKANTYDIYNPSMTNWWAVNNWYGSVGIGLELTIQQLPLSFFLVKRFKISGYGGFEWVNNSPGTANLDFVLSIVGFYF